MTKSRRHIYKKPKRVMSEKQLENLKKARLIAHAKLKDKKRETQFFYLFSVVQVKNRFAHFWGLNTILLISNFLS